MSTTSLSHDTTFVEVPPIPTRIVETNAQREQHFLSMLSTILIGCYCFVTAIFSLVAVFSSQFFAWVMVGMIVVGLGLTVLSRYLSRHPATVRLGSWIIVCYTLFAQAAAMYMLGSAQPLPGAFLIPLSISLFLLSWRATVGLMAVAITAAFSLYLLEMNGYQAPLLIGRVEAAYLAMGIWFAIILTPILLCFFMVTQIKQAFGLAIEQTEQVNKSLLSLENKRQYGQMVSERIVSVTAELNATASQQAMGSQQQATALNGSISSVQELAQTAQIVAAKTETIDQQMQKMLSSTKDVKIRSEAVAQIGERGRQAIESTIGSNQQVGSLYQTLVQTLTTLEGQSNQIKGIIDLLNTISDETHLLSLNAAIEAAGAGEYGERFGVVAREVKNLSDRSTASSRQASIILHEVEEGIKQAVKTAQHGQRETQAAVEVAQESGLVMNDLAGAVASSTQEVSKIAETVKIISELTKEINYAASQQHSASQQAVERLVEVGAVAHQSASGSVQLNHTATSLEELSHGLTTALST